MTGTLSWKRAEEETHIGAYDIMFSFTPEASSRIGFVQNAQGNFIIPKK